MVCLSKIPVLHNDTKIQSCDSILTKWLQKYAKNRFKSLTDKNNLTDINGNEILIKKSDISKYDKDILFYNYEDKNEDEPDIDELTKIILQEIENMKNEIMWFSKMSDDFLKNKDTSIEYNKYKEMPANKNIDEKFENIIKHYDVMIEQNGL